MLRMSITQINNDKDKKDSCNKNNVNINLIT